MARKNTASKSYAERHAERIQNGTAPAPEAVEEEEVNELDRPEVQAEILRPETVDVPLDNGEVITLPTKITLGQSFEKRTHQVIQALMTVFVKAVRDLSGDEIVDAGWFNRNQVYFPLVVYKAPVQNVIADFIGLLGRVSPDDIKPKIVSSTVTTAFLLALRITQEAKAGEPDSKNETAAV